MASQQFPNWEPSQINAEFFHAPSILTEVGDLVYWDAAAGFVKPASSLPDGGTAAATRASFAPLFMGISNSQQKADDATGRNARILIDRVVEFPCISGTFAVGDLVAPAYSAGLADQVLDKTATAGEAIGKVVKRYTTATTRVKVRLTARQLVGLVRP